MSKFKSLNKMRGGKRENSGRKRSENKKIRVSYSLAPDVVAYLNSRNDKPKAQVIEDAIRSLRDQLLALQIRFKDKY